MSAAPAPLRPTLETRSFTRDGRRFVAVRDRLGLARSREPFVVPLELWRVAERFDGARDPAALAHDLAAPLSAGAGDGSAAVGEETVRKVARLFAHERLLADRAFARERALAAAEYRALSERAPIGAGVDYDGDPVSLRILVGGLVANDWDLETPPGLAAAWAPATDVGRAGPLYARAYASLRHQASRFARVVVLGAYPAPLERTLVVSARPLATPLGTSAHDAEAFAALALDPGDDELAHRDALVLERQALFLRVLCPRLACLFALVGAPDGALDEPAEHPGVRSALAALERVRALPGETLLVVASDGVHVATDEHEPGPGPAAARAIRDADRAAADRAAELDPAGFWRAAWSGAPEPRARSPLALWLALRLLESAGGAQGTVLGYRQIRSNTELITATAMVFYRGSAGGPPIQRPT